MSSPRDLERLVGDPGFTPGARDLPALVQLVERDGDAAPLVRALGRLRAPSSVALEARLREPDARRVPLLRALRKLAPERAGAVGLALVADEAPDVRREAARALRGADPAQARSALRAMLQSEEDPSVLRAVVEALGFVGEPKDEARVRARAATAELGSFADRALLRLARVAPGSGEGAAAGRRETSPTDDLGRDTLIALRARTGFAEVLVEELADRLALRAAVWGAGPLAGAVVVRGTCLGPLVAARTWYQLSVVLEEPAAGSGPLAERAASLLATSLPERFFRHRLDLAFGKRRAEVFRVASHLSEVGHPNDPSGAPWTLSLHDRARDGRLRIELTPRLGAERFAYRKREVPAASHPTVAAALARLGGVRAEDVVWDPFVGSGLELRERDLLGPASRLIGSDTSDAALAAARANLEGARAPVTLLLHDAGEPLAFAERPTLVLTNPPLGRRVGRGESHKLLLLKAFDLAARALAPRGRLVWLSPFPRDTRSHARTAGLELSRHAAVDLDGIAVELQAFEKVGDP